MALRKVTIYREDSTSQVVYDNVKHAFWTANGTVLTLAIVTDEKTGKHQYIHWLREKIAWYREEQNE